MVQTFLLFDTITNEKTLKFMQRDIITSTITRYLGLVGFNNFGEYTSFSPFTLVLTAINLLQGIISEVYGCLPLWMMQSHTHIHPCLMGLTYQKLNILVTMWITRILFTIFYLCILYWPIRKINSAFNLATFGQALGLKRPWLMVKIWFLFKIRLIFCIAFNKVHIRLI